MRAAKFLGWMMGLSRHGHIIRPTGTRHVLLLNRAPSVTFADGRTRPQMIYTWTPCSSTRLTTTPDSDERYSGGKKCKRCAEFMASERGRAVLLAAMTEKP